LKVISNEIIFEDFNWAELAELSVRQPTWIKTIGLNFEILGVKARSELKREFLGYTFEWTGRDGYNQEEPQAGGDFIDHYKGHSDESEYKNPSPNYYFSQYEATPKKVGSYVISALKPTDPTPKKFAKRGIELLVVGQEQLKEYPLTDDGEVKPKYLDSVRRIKTFVIRQVITPVVTSMLIRAAKEYPCKSPVSEQIFEALKKVKTAKSNNHSNGSSFIRASNVKFNLWHYVKAYRVISRRGISHNIFLPISLSSFSHRFREIISSNALNLWILEGDPPKLRDHNSKYREIMTYLTRRFAGVLKK